MIKVMIKGLGEVNLNHIGKESGNSNPGCVGKEEDVDKEEEEEEPVIFKPNRPPQPYYLNESKICLIK